MNCMSKLKVFLLFLSTQLYFKSLSYGQIEKPVFSLEVDTVQICKNTSCTFSLLTFKITNNSDKLWLIQGDTLKTLASPINFDGSQEPTNVSSIIVRNISTPLNEPLIGFYDADMDGGPSQCFSNFLKLNRVLRKKKIANHTYYVINSKSSIHIRALLFLFYEDLRRIPPLEPEEKEKIEMQLGTTLLYMDEKAKDLKTEFVVSSPSTSLKNMILKCTPSN